MKNSEAFGKKNLYFKGKVEESSHHLKWMNCRKYVDKDLLQLLFFFQVTLLLLLHI